MMKIADPGRRAVRALSLAAAGLLMLSAVVDQRAEALSLINPGAAPAAKHISDGQTTAVRGGRGGGGGGFRGGGGFCGGGAGLSFRGVRGGGGPFPWGRVC